MRILHIASGDFFSTYGGGQVYVKNVVDQMIKEGDNVCVISFTGDSSGVVHKDYNGIDLFEISSVELLEETILLARPDVIHAHSEKYAASRIGKELDIPVVVTSHHGGILCPAGTRLNCRDEICHVKTSHEKCLPCVLRAIPGGLRVWYPLLRHMPESAYRRVGDFLTGKSFIPFLSPIGMAARHIASRRHEWTWICKDCSLMIAPCYEIAEAMLQNGLPTEKVRVIPHGIPLPKERPPYPVITDGKIKFYYVGRICYVKGIHTLLEAFRSVGDSRIELHLIGGAGNKREHRYMIKLQKRHRDDKRIIWHGKIAPEAVFEATRNYHVSSSSSSFLEAFGLNIAEALALGKPVLATRSGGAEMQITDGVNGWLVPTNDPKALEGKIREIIASPDRLKEMSDNCHAISIANHCKELIKVYHEVACL